ncbi:hypothetical protein [Butyricimonas paravirosa]
MDIHNLKTVACYNSRLLLRSWMFRLFLLLLFLIVILYQVLAQTNIFYGVNSGLVTLSSYLPHENAYLFTILQIVPLIFLAGSFLGKERKMDSMDTVYYRPESNADYVVGMMLGFTKTFMTMAGISLVIGMLLHIFASESPFNFWLYPFYWFTMIFPALIFALGFSFFIHTWVRHRGLSILILLVVFGVFLFQLGKVREGLFDPFGLSLPNAFSEVTGHPGMALYLMQRVCWLFVGMGFAGLAVLMFQRLPNRPVNRKRVMIVGVGCLVLGVLFGGVVYMARENVKNIRELYAETYNKYQKFPKGNVVSNTLEVEQKGNVLSGKSTLLVKNRGDQELSEIILYLNPALVVSAIKEGETDVAFERENQVIRVTRRLLPGEDVELTVKYSGGIDERVCYLDVDFDKLFQLQPIPGHSSTAGKRFAFVGDDFTVLTPECLWYPVAQPSVNPASPYDALPDFTSYSLQVASTDGRMVIAPGKRETKEGRVCFTGDIPLPGMGLCIGNFEKYDLVVDSTLYELYLFTGHGKLLRGFEEIRDSIPAIIRDARYNVEEQMGITYPYSQLTLVETPVSFSGFARPNKGGSEMAQPGMLFLPERGIGMWNDHKAEVAFRKRMIPEMSSFYSSTEDMLSSDLTRSLSSMFLNEYRYNVNQASLLLYSVVSPSLLWRGGVASTSVGNLYTISPMFYEQTMALHSAEYPAINSILTDALKKSNTFFISYSETDPVERFTGRSVGDLFRDRLDNPYEAATLLHEKTRELLRLLSVRDVPTEQISEFLATFIRENRFRQVEFDEMNREFIEKFGVDWMDVLPSWYENRKVPVFFVRDFKVENITSQEDGEGRLSDVTFSGNFVVRDRNNVRSRVLVSVFNDSDIDGVVSFEAREMMSSGINMRRQSRGDEKVATRNFLIKAGAGKQIAVVMEGMSFAFNTNISKNLPTNFLAFGLMGVSKTTDTTEYVKDLERSYFMPAPGEIIVDNEDENFKLNSPSSRRQLRNLISPLKESKYEMGSSITIREGGEVVPRHMINSEAYGLNKLTHAFMLQGSKATMEWIAQIEREGEYEILAYIPPKVLAHRVEEQAKGGKMSGFISLSYSAVTEIEPEEVKQYYVVAVGGEKQEVSVDIKEHVGWVSLGRFQLPVGECKIVLTDQGNKDQVLLGDAIKWIYMEDK